MKNFTAKDFFVTIFPSILVIFLIFFIIMPNVRKERAEEAQQSKITNSTEKIKVAATIYPLYDILREVGGDEIEPILILPPGASPHTYEVTPGQVKNLQDIKIFFSIGEGVDDWVHGITKTIDGSVSIKLSKYIDLKEFHMQGHDDEISDHDHGNIDPHYWLNPQNAKIIAKELSYNLKKFDIKNTDQYESQYNDFVSKIDNNIMIWRNKLSELDNKDIIVFHDAWGYFADFFGINIVASFEPFPGKTPSPKYLIHLQEEVEANNIKNLFVEPQLSKEAISTLAKDLNLNIGVLDPIGGVENRDTYIKMMEFNVNSIYNTLK